MANKKKPNEFPLKAVLDGLEELYTQTNGVNAKFLVDQIVQRANATGLNPLVFTFTNVNTFSGIHNLGRRPIIEVVESDGLGGEITIDVQITATSTTFKIDSNSLITGKIYIF